MANAFVCLRYFFCPYMSMEKGGKDFEKQQGNEISAQGMYAYFVSHSHKTKTSISFLSKWFEPSLLFCVRCFSF